MFYESIASNANRHTGDYVADRITDTIDKVGAQKVIGVCTDNGSNMRAAWPTVELKYLGVNAILTCYSCAAHTLNLMFKDIFEIPQCAVILYDSKEIIKAVRNKTMVNAHFNTLRSKHHCNTTLKLPVPTRFSSQYPSLKSLTINRAALTELAIDQTYRQSIDFAIRKTILSDTYWNKLDFLLSLLKPIKDWITMLEGDQPNISEVVEAFHEIEKSFNDRLDRSFLSRHKQVLLRSIRDRREMCVTDLHLAANLLDPKLKGMLNFVKTSCGRIVCICDKNR